MSNRLILIISSIVVVILASLSVVYALSKRIPMNDELTVGNTAGNLYNGGIVHEMDGRVYFANPLENDCLYSMNPDESDVQPITVMGVRNITGAGKYLYYYLDTTKTTLSDSSISGLGKVSTFYGLYRSDLSGKNQKLLDRNRISEIQLVGSYIYYTVPLGTDAGVHAIRIDGKEKRLVTTEAFNPSCAKDGTIYYSGIDLDHNLHSLDTLSMDNVSTVLEGNIWQPIIEGEYVYFIDAAHHYRL